VVQIGEKMVDYHKDFQLFLVSRSISPDISPSAASVISLVNFSTTPAGLGAQVCYTYFMQISNFNNVFLV
jgi:dynein heavy chain 2